MRRTQTKSRLPTLMRGWRLGGVLALLLLLCSACPAGPGPGPDAGEQASSPDAISPDAGPSESPVVPEEQGVVEQASPEPKGPESPTVETPNKPLAWALSCGGAKNDVGLGLAQDPQGNLYVTGAFQETATFGAETLTSAGADDIFIAKFDKFGTLLWAKRAGGAASDQGTALAVDPNGEVYITGTFGQSAKFGTHSITAQTPNDLFVARLDKDGTFVWAKAAGGAGDNYSNRIALDVDQNVYITGRFQQSAKFGDQTLSSSGGDDLFVAKLDKDGAFVWAKQAGSPSFDEGRGIAVDAQGNVFVTGFAQTVVKFGTVSVLSQGVFVAKYDKDGKILWAKANQGSASGQGRAIALNAKGEAFITGQFNGAEARFGSFSLKNSNNFDIFVAKLDKDGTFLWASAAGDKNLDVGLSLSPDADDAVFLAGYFQETAKFGSQTLTSAGGGDAFVAKLDKDGTFVWAKALAGSGFVDWAHAVLPTSDNHVALAGVFQQQVSLDAFSLSSKGENEIFLLRLANP